MDDLDWLNYIPVNFRIWLITPSELLAKHYYLITLNYTNLLLLVYKLLLFNIFYCYYY